MEVEFSTLFRKWKTMHEYLLNLNQTKFQATFGKPYTTHHIWVGNAFINRYERYLGFTQKDIECLV